MTGHKASFDYLRIIAIFLVIGLHINAQDWKIVVEGKVPWHVFCLSVYNTLPRIAVPIFVMISGANFLNPDKHMDVKKLYLKYISRMIIVYMAWSLIYSIRGGGMRSGKIAFLASVIKGGRYHLWFLPLIVGLYVLVPVMRKVVEDIRLIGYFLILAFIFTFLIPAVLSVKFPEGSVFNILATAFYGMYSNMKFYFTLGYTAFFVAGYFFETISLHTHIRYFIYFTGIGAVCITIGVTYYTAMHSITLDNAFYFLFDLFGALAFFVFVKYKAALESLSVKKEQYIKSIANHVFGIYLVHVMVIDELRQAGMNVRKIPIIQVPFNTMLVFGISLGITYCLRKIPLIKRIV